MTPGFRYHVITIAAIFLALGVGVMIGSSFVQSAIVQQQTKQVAELRKTYAEEVVESRIVIKRYADFISALARRLDGRLTGTRVALIQTGDYPDAVATVREALDKAGATVSSVTTLDPNFVTTAQVKLTSLLPRLQTTHPGFVAETKSLLQLIASAAARPGGEADMALLEEARLLRRDGDYAQSNDVVILVSGATAENENRAETVDAPLLTLLSTAGVTSILVEPEKADISAIPAVRKMDVTTIDNVETDLGRVALILAIRGPRGHYGVKTTATSGLVPPAESTDDLRRGPGL